MPHHAPDLHLKFNINNLQPDHFATDRPPHNSLFFFFSPPAGPHNRISRQRFTDSSHRLRQKTNLSRRSTLSTPQLQPLWLGCSHVWLRGGCWLLLAPPHDYTPGHARNAPSVVDGSRHFVSLLTPKTASFSVVFTTRLGTREMPRRSWMDHDTSFYSDTQNGFFLGRLHNPLEHAL